MPGDHAPFSPSSSVRWLACPWAVEDPEKAEASQDTVYTVKGTTMHTHSEKHLNAWTDPRLDFSALPWKNPDTGADELIQPDEWHPHVIPYVEGVREIYETKKILGHDPALWIEKKVVIAGRWCWGTCDAAIVVPGVSLDIVDLKTGSGHVVPPDSDQFKTYAVGFLDLVGWDLKDGAVNLHRAQSAAEIPWATATVPLEELKEHAVRVSRAIKAARSRTGEPTPANINPECHWCNKYKNGTCAAHFQRAVQVLKDHDAKAGEDGALALPEPAEVVKKSKVKLEWLLAHMDEIGAWFSSVRKHVVAEMLAGRLELLGFKVVEGNSRREWDPAKDPADIAEEITNMADMIGEKLDPWEPSLLSFATAEKVLGKGSVDHLVVKPPGSPKLVPYEDKKASIDRLAILED